MFKSIFRKQFAVSFFTVFISIIFLALVFFGFTRNYMIDQKKIILQEQGLKIANISLAPYWEHLNDFFVAPIIKEQVGSELQKMQEFLDVSLIITDDEFNAILASENIVKDISGQKLDLPLFDTVRQGESLFLQGNLKGLLNEDVLTVVNPVLVKGKFEGAVLISSPMSGLNKSYSDMLRITITSLIFVTGLSFILVYISSKTISKPIQEINEAAKVIANGDFEKRLQVRTKDEVGQLAISFNNMAESLFRQEKYRRDFIANISHDLRSPLTSMKGFLSAILDGTVPDEKRDKYLGIVLEETGRLSKLANDLLDIGKIENFSLELNRTDFDINEVLKKIILSLENRFIDKNLHVDMIFADERSIVWADNEKIQRVIYNLLDNAIKFSDNGGKISIETTLIDKKINISIKDSGKGLNEEEQKRVFDRFYKADTSRGEDKKGSGLGLSIVKEFIKAHGESIELESKQGEGCKFTFALPLSKGDV